MFEHLKKYFGTFQKYFVTIYLITFRNLNSEI